MVSPYFPPRRRVGSLRPFKFAIHLKDFGWKPVVLTISPSGSSLSDKEKQLLEGITIIEVTPPFDRTEKKQKNGSDKLKTGTAGGSRVSGWIDKNTPVDSWLYLFWVKYLVIQHQVKKSDPDVIWSTGDPWSGHWLADKLAQDTSLPWVADFRDPWTLTNVNLRRRSPFSAQIDRETERRVVEKSDKLIFTSKATELNYKEFYGLPADKSATIYNSSDKNLFEDEQMYSWKGNLDPGNLNILFFGAFRRLSPSGPVARALHVLKKTDPETTNKIRIHSFGENSTQDKVYIENLGLSENFIEHRPVLPEQTLSVLNQADVLLVSTHSARRNIIPAKLWDYLAASRPVLSIAPNPEIADILEQSKAGIQLQPDNPLQIAEQLTLFLKAKQNGEPVLPGADGVSSERQKFDAEATTAKLAAIFDELTDHG